VSGASAIHVVGPDESGFVRRDWLDGGIPVIGSSRDLSCEMVHVGVMRRSAETSGVAPGLLGSEGTVIRSEMSCGVVRDMVWGLVGWLVGWAWVGRAAFTTRSTCDAGERDQA